MQPELPWQPITELVRRKNTLDPHSATAPPIYQTATFVQSSASEFGTFDYSRSGNPTRRLLEEELARLEAGQRGLAFGSGMAALSTLLRLVPAGGRILAGRDLYGGTTRLLEHVLAPSGIATDFVDTSDSAAVECALSHTRYALLLFESPSNPLLRVSDIALLARLARQHGALCAVDNTTLSPWLQNPLELGADVVVHSATKFLAGHSDVSAGALVVRDCELGERLAFLQNAEGNALAPFDSWLVLRGLKTLALRVERAQSNACALARFLQRHPRVKAVHYPGLADFPLAAVQAQQARGSGALLSFETGDVDFSRRLVESTQLFSIAVSFGGLGSQISLPCAMSHKSASPARRAHLPPDLVRLGVGVEAACDLETDLEQALARASNASGRAVASAGCGASSGSSAQGSEEGQRSAQSHKEAEPKEEDEQGLGVLVHGVSAEEGS